MTKQILDRNNVSTCIEQLGRHRMAKPMATNVDTTFI
jgi:hypothetical protein